MIYWILFILLEIRRNYVIIEIDKERPNYLHSFGFRAFFAFLGICITYPHYDPIMEIYKVWPYIVFQLSSFWILFDLGLNISRGKELLYKGKNSGLLDRLPIGIYATLKLIVLGIMLYSIKIVING